MIIFQWGLGSGACLRIPGLGFYWGDLLFEHVQLFWTRDNAALVNTAYLMGCCNLMLIQPRIKFVYCSLLWLTLNIRAEISISHLSIPGIVADGRCYISHCFCFFFLAIVLNCFSCSACILQTRINQTSYLFFIILFFSAFIFRFLFFYLFWFAIHCVEMSWCH